MWFRPFDSRDDGAIVDVIDEFITDVVRPYHAHRINHKLMKDENLTSE